MATSVTGVDSEESGGLDLSFVQAPPDDLICSICLSVHRKPVLTSCCGNHFCFSCVEQVRSDQRPCPLCGAEHFTTMLDKYFVRKVNELEVACKHKERGCPWQGCVAALERHLDTHNGDCKYMRIKCPYFCGAVLVHCELTDHQKVCNKRPYMCKFCEYKGVYEDMSAKHWKMCEKYPLPCPNQCGEAGIERSLMEKHLNESCPLHKKKCEFEYAGCTQCLSGSEMSEHVASSMQYHLSLMAKHCLQLSQTFSSNFQSKMEKTLQASDSELKILLKDSDDKISTLQSKLELLEDEIDDLKNDNFQLKSIVFIPPFEFMMLGFRNHKENSQQWISPSFYTHFGGYRMCISVDASGSEEGHDTHVSVYANLMKGEYDDHLKWPFKGCITIELCNQRDPKGNLTEMIVFTYDASEIASRVTGAEIAEHGLGIPTFIEHSKLNLRTKNNVDIQYLKNDCLKFRVLKVDLMEQRRASGVKR